MSKSSIRKKLILTTVMLALALGTLAAVPALAQTEPDPQTKETKETQPKAETKTETEPQPEPKTEARTGSGGSVRGTITSISGAVVLVEEDPADESGSAKGAFTVTGETEILRQQGGEQVPAAFGDLRAGQLVEATYAGDVAESYPSQGKAGSIVILEPSGDGPGPAPGTTATLSFELTVEGEPPADASFFGFIPAEGGIRAPLTDPDGDGVYTGSTTVPKFPPGPAPPDTEPVSLPVQIVQTQPGAYHSRDTVLKDFGEVLIEGDKTFSASVSFDEEPDPDEVAATGVLEELETTSFQYGTHALIDDDTEEPVYALTSESVPLEVYAGKLVTIHGALVPGYEDGLDGGPPLVEVARVDAPPGGPGGGFVTLDFELTVKGEPPANATFFGMAGVDLADIWLDESVQLADPDDDGVYTGSIDVPAGRPITVWITQGTGTRESHSGTAPGEPFTVIKHFGTKTFYEDATFKANVSFPGSGGSGSGGSGNGGSGSGTSLGGITGGVRGLLPNTGGSMALTTLGAGALLISGGFLIRKFARRYAR